MALEMDGAGRTFGPTLALRPQRLQLERGAVLVVTGRNGSGKSTLLRLAAGLLTPSTGTVRHAPPALYLRPGDGARDAQTPRGALASAARLRGLAAPQPDALPRVGLGGAPGRRRVRHLSSGQRARLTLAIALTCAPGLICLDEPSAHLDEDGIGLVREVCGELAAAGAGVLVATHDRALLAMADAHLVLHDGLAEPVR